MIVTVITESDIAKVLDIIQSIHQQIDVIEWRLDFLDEINIEAINSIHAKIPYPVIFTLRAKEHGGHFNGSESERLALLLDLAGLLPAYIDVESFVNDSFIAKVNHAFPSVRIIRSYHNFTDTPNNLDEILDTMKNPHVDVYKLITFAQSSLDSLRVLHFVKTHSKHDKLVSHCMGELGLPSRIVGMIVGNYFFYTQLSSDNKAAPHCPDLSTLSEVYHIQRINRETRVFALLGDPIDHSVGHVFHNQRFSENSIDAVYLKIRLTEDDLKDFFELIKGLPFLGFSVTMPLKEKVIPYLDSIESYAKPIGAINTIMVKEDALFGTNTDGKGAVDSIAERRLVNKSHVLVIGAGGAARAIVHELRLRSPLSLTMLNRTLANVEKIADHVDAEAFDYETFSVNEHQQFDMVINTVPTNEDNDRMIVNSLKPYLSDQTIYMSIDYAHPSVVIKTELMQIQCSVIDPKAMFINQALRQIDYWFDTCEARFEMTL